MEAAGLAAIGEPPDRAVIEHDRCRRDFAVRRLIQGDFPVASPPAGVSLFLRVPDGDGTRFALETLDRGVAVTPGAAFGPTGVPSVRISLTHDDDRLEEGLRRMLVH